MDRDELMYLYFSLGFNHKEILNCLAYSHGIIISLRTLRRSLKSMNLYRRKFKSDIVDVAVFVESQLQKHGQLHGYKLMHLKCIQNGLVVTQDTVRHLLHVLDPEGVEYRRKRRLRRRSYSSLGPNYFWHVDSYDKLKPFGVCINAAIDGFSRNIIWLQAYKTSSDPAVIAGYFITEVERRKGCPSRVRADLGTENGHIEQMMKFLRHYHDDEYANNCFVYGSSNHNQRIEGWWAFLRKHFAQYWMNKFQDLKDTDKFCGDYLDKNLIRFCFMSIIQVCI